MQSASAALANLPDADVLIDFSPQRILTRPAPEFMTATDLAKMRGTFADIKKAAGVDPSAVEYLVIALAISQARRRSEFRRAGHPGCSRGRLQLRFTPDSCATNSPGQTAPGEARVKNDFVDARRSDSSTGRKDSAAQVPRKGKIGAVALSANSIAVGNLPYLKSAVEAAEGTGRINPATLESLMRDPNVLVAATGAPLSSIAKGFCMFAGSPQLLEQMMS